MTATSNLIKRILYVYSILRASATGNNTHNGKGFQIAFELSKTHMTTLFLPLIINTKLIMLRNIRQPDSY